MDTNPFELEVAAELRARVARYEVTQTDLGHAIGLSQSQTSKVLRGLRTLTVGQLHAAADYLRTDASAVCASAEREVQR